MNDYFSVYQLFQPSSNLRTARQNEASQLVASEPAQPVPGATIHQLQPTWHDPGLQLAEANFQVRAVLIRPAANTDWSGIFHSAKKAGFNQVWIDVFSEGQPHLASDTSPGEPSVLARAIALGAATGTSVTAVVNLLQWDKNTPLDSEDLTLNGVPYGLDSKNQSDVTAARYGYSQDNASKPWDGSANYVAPYASPATASLRSLVRLLASTGGLSTVAFCGTSPPGYARDDSSGLWTGQIGLGYTTQMRLGFLRKEHTDPIDLSEDSESMVRPTDTSLPYFPDNNSVDPIAKAWNAFRMAANKELLMDVWQKATEFKPQNPNVWIGVGFYDSPASWYGLWDGRTSDTPKVSDHMETVSEGFISRMPKTLPRAGDITVFRGFQDSSSLTVESALARMPRSWNGFLLDYSDSQAANPLAIFEPQQTDSNPAK